MFGKKLLLTVVAVLLLTAPINASKGENIWYSMLFPGWGQLRAKRFGRGTIMAAAELISLTSLAVTQIQYNRAVEQYDRAKSLYLTADYIGDALYQYNTMNEKWDDAERLHKYRIAMLGTAVGVWAISVLDMMLGPESEGPAIEVTASADGFLVTKKISF